MLLRITILAAFAITLSGCSYVYDLLAVVRNGHIVFFVDPKSKRSPSCLREIEVWADGERTAIWRDSVDYDDGCANTFPVGFGAKFKGRHQPEWPTIDAKPLQPGVVYEVHATTGATGYGEGRFSINASGQVVNLNAHDVTSSGNARTGI